MDKNVKVILIFVVVLFLIGGLFIFRNIDLKPSPSELEQCNLLIAGEKQGASIVLFADESTAEKYSEELMASYPFNETKDFFSVYYIDNYKPSCTLYRGIALYCDSKELRRKAASCPNDYIVVLDNQPSNIRSSSYMNIVSINRNHPISVLMHEFGHSFGNLEEEYIGGNIDSKKMNCLSSCDEFNGKSEGCFKGCSENELYRSIEAGVMRTLSSNEYGKYDSLLLLDKIRKQTGKTITGNAIEDTPNCQSNSFYIVEAKIENRKISIEKISQKSGCLGNTQTDSSGNYIKWSTSSAEGEIKPLLFYTDEQNIQTESIITGELLTYEGIFYFSIPASEKEDELVLKDSSGKEITRSKLHNLEDSPCEIN